MLCLSLRPISLRMDFQGHRECFLPLLEYITVGATGGQKAGRFIKNSWQFQRTRHLREMEETLNNVRQCRCLDLKAACAINRKCKSNEPVRSLH